MLSEQATEVGFEKAVISFIYFSDGTSTPKNVMGYKSNCTGSLVQAPVAEYQTNSWTFLMESKTRADLFVLRALDKSGACGVTTLTA